MADYQQSSSDRFIIILDTSESFNFVNCTHKTPRLVAKGYY